ncbi:MAG TPA: hypothetical protein VMT63_04630 [Bacteroidales bacterium]|nr:hypothetical protein [Bacteroidales bacterium]
MYYLVTEILDEPRCIDINEKNIYADGQVYDCLLSYPFREGNKRKVSEISFLCSSEPGFPRRGIVFSD